MAGALAAAEPLVLRGVVDELVGGRRLPLLVRLVGGFLLLILVREAASAVANWLSWRTRLAVQHAILDATVDRLHALSLAYHKTQPVGSLLTKIDRGIQGLVGAFAEVCFNVVPAFTFLVLAIVMMIRLEWRLFLMMLVLVPLPTIVGVYASPVQVKRERTLLDRWARIYARFNEVLTGILTVKSFAMEKEEKQRFIKEVEGANRAVIQGVGFDARVSAAQNLVVGLTRVLIVAYGAHLVLEGRMSVGTLMAFLGYAAGLFGPLQGLTSSYQVLRRGKIGYDVIFSILDADDGVRDAPGALEVGPLKGEIAFDNVWFGYDPNRPVLRGITLKIAAGQTVALVGPSGGGKTSLSVLLQRLYDPQNGEIAIDGIDVKLLTQRSLRRQIGVVMQDAILFNDTVRANIAYGRPEASAAEIEVAARTANAHDFIMALPQGYDTEVGERGGQLSAGQRQRIAIARALLKNPAIVILDEATSALDAESEAAVQEALERLLAGRTTLVIAHRLATIVKADLILVLRGGRIIEEGSHPQLLAAQGYYASMVALQTRGLIGGGGGQARGP
jgi:ATP-binding cassette subfamily B protein